MAKDGPNIAASVKNRLLVLSRAQGRSFDILLVRFALERVLYRLSISKYADQFILKGGMLVTHWLPHNNRETRDMDFLGFGDSSSQGIVTTFSEVMAIESHDGLVIDIDALKASPIREDMEYGGIRLRTKAYLERTSIPLTIDIGFGDALAQPSPTMDYPSLLGMDRPQIRTYPPASVLAEKFHAIVTLGLANGRMKDFYDLWVIPQSIPIDNDDLAAAIKITFERRNTDIPVERPIGLSQAMADDKSARQRWNAYVASMGLPALAFHQVLDDIWQLIAPNCLPIGDV
jgi:predicted nucleotidyltransferase component of viral defense system